MCPYCDSDNLDAPQPLVREGTEALIALGIEIPHIQMCQDCDATLSPNAFIQGTKEYHECSNR